MLNKESVQLSRSLGGPQEAPGAPLGRPGRHQEHKRFLRVSGGVSAHRHIYDIVCIRILVPSFVYTDSKSVMTSVIFTQAVSDSNRHLEWADDPDWQGISLLA